MSDCIFCKIIAGEIPCSKVYEDEYVLAFRDIHPVTPVHVLLVPKLHVADMNELAAREDADAIMGQIVRSAAKVAELEGLKESGYRLINNCGRDAGQTIQHLHFHLLGGQVLGEKLI